MTGRLFEVRGRGKPLEDFKQGSGRAGFGFLAVMNNAVRNIHVHLCVFMCSSGWTSVLFLLGIYLGVEFLGHLGILWHLLMDCQTVFPTGSYRFTVLPAVQEGSSFSHLC